MYGADRKIYQERDEGEYKRLIMRQLKQEYQEEVSSAMSDNGIPKDKIFFRYQCPAGIKGTFRNRNQSWIYLTKKSYSRIRNTWLDDEIMNHMLCLISQDLERFPAYKNKNFFFSSHFFLRDCRGRRRLVTQRQAWRA